jgi:hypothetical protein
MRKCKTSIALAIVTALAGSASVSGTSLVNAGAAAEAAKVAIDRALATQNEALTVRIGGGGP